MLPQSVDLTASSARSAQALIAEVVAFAKAQGIDQATLASRAGISAESLSRLKKAGSCRLETALALARVAGFTGLELATPARPSAAASISAKNLSAGRPRPITAEELVLALRSGAPRDEQRAHLIGFFEELPIELVHDVCLDEHLDYASILAMAKTLDAEGEILDWLAEMAGNGLAGSARADATRP